MALSRMHWQWLDELVDEWTDTEDHPPTRELTYEDGLRDGRHLAADELAQTLVAIKSYYE